MSSHQPSQRQMKVGDWAEWRLATLGGAELTPMRGWIIALEGEHAVIRRSSYRTGDLVSPFATVSTRDLIQVPVENLPVVQVGSALTT